MNKDIRVGDRVRIANPAYCHKDEERLADGWVEASAYGKVGEVIDINYIGNFNVRYISNGENCNQYVAIEYLTLIEDEPKEEKRPPSSLDYRNMSLWFGEIETTISRIRKLQEEIDRCQEVIAQTQERIDHLNAKVKF